MEAIDLSCINHHLLLQATTFGKKRPKKQIEKIDKTFTIRISTNYRSSSDEMYLGTIKVIQNRRSLKLVKKTVFENGFYDRDEIFKNSRDWFKKLAFKLIDKIQNQILTNEHPLDKLLSSNISSETFKFVIGMYQLYIGEGSNNLDFLKNFHDMIGKGIEHGFMEVRSISGNLPKDIEFLVAQIHKIVYSCLELWRIRKAKQLGIVGIDQIRERILPEPTGKTDIEDIIAIEDLININNERHYPDSRSK